MRRRDLLGAPLLAAAAAENALRITGPPDGAILNRHDGRVTASGLEVEVRGECPSGAQVRVNGQAAAVQGGSFSARVVLRQHENEVTAECGARRATAIYLWDRHSFPRFRVSTDDNIWFLRDIALNAARYSSLFENPYLAFWREMNRKYGAKIHFNIYYETEGFNLSQMPEKFKTEWQQNCHWLRLTFHARANDPDRPYLNAPASQVIADYRLVTREIERFAGKPLLSPVTTIHWGELTREAAIALRKEGIKILPSYFEIRDGRPRVSYYLDLERVQYASRRDYWKDTQTDLLFVRHDIVMNTVPLDKIVPHMERLAADPHQSEVLELMIHEQYFYPSYRSYQPDFKQRVETTIAWAAKKGYKPVFFGEGFFGAPL
jgi:hypothetical protein